MWWTLSFLIFDLPILSPVYRFIIGICTQGKFLECPTSAVPQNHIQKDHMLDLMLNCCYLETQYYWNRHYHIFTLHCASKLSLIRLLNKRSYLCSLFGIVFNAILTIYIRAILAPRFSHWLFRFPWSSLLPDCLWSSLVPASSHQHRSQEQHSISIVLALGSRLFIPYILCIILEKIFIKHLLCARYYSC